MQTVRELAARSGARSSVFSLRAEAQKHGTSSLRDTMAGYLLSDHHRRTGRAFGPLGALVGGVTRRRDGTYEQKTQLGIMELGEVFGEDTRSHRLVGAQVELAAVKCFDTDDPGDGDEAYLVISVINLDPNFKGVDSLVFSHETGEAQVVDDNVFFEAHTLGSGLHAHAFPGSGIRIHVAVFDHEHGDRDEMRDQIHKVLDDAAKKGASALAGAAAANDPRLAGAAGDVTEFEIGGVKPFKILTLGLADAIAHLLSDDLIGEHEFIVPAKDIVEWAEYDEATQSHPKYEASLRGSPDLPSRIRFNWPRRTEDEFMFSGGGGNYKVYFRIRPFPGRVPVDPKIP